jgi:hypothetical protein
MARVGGMGPSFLIFVAAGTLGGCSDASLEGESAIGVVTQAQSLSVTYTVEGLPLGANPTDVALCAKYDLHINDRAQVKESPTASRYGLITNISDIANYTGIGGYSTAGSIESNAQHVQLRSHANVQGSVYSTRALEEQSGVTVTGNRVTGLSFDEDISWSRTAYFPGTHQSSPNLEPGV